jgi:hypothetical protein
MSQHIATYLANKEKQESTPFKIIGGTGYYIVDGKPIHKDEYESQYPIEPIITLDDPKRWKGENKDKTKNWMHDKKSY